MGVSEALLSVFGADEGLFFHPVVIHDAKIVQLHHPVGGLLLRADAGEVHREAVDGIARIGAWPGGGVPADDAGGVDSAALDDDGRPAGFDGAVGTLSSVDDGHQWWGEIFDEPEVLHLAVQCGGANANGLRQLGDGCCASAMIDKQAEPFGCGDVLAAFNVGGAAVPTAPSGGACAG